MLEVLQAFGFGPHWREWIAILFRTTTSRALLNGTLGPKFSHARGVRQGDPLSPMLFILAMDPLQRLLDMATDHNVLTGLPLAIKWRMSMYADNAQSSLAPKKKTLRPSKLF